MQAGLGESPKTQAFDVPKGGVMARIRTVKPEFFRHYGLYKAEKESKLSLRVAFAGLWTTADREGRFRWVPEELKLDCLPYDDVDFSRVLDALATRGFIVRYTSNNIDFGWIPGFLTHQVINNRERDSILPEPPPLDDLRRVDDAFPTPLNSDQGEGKGREGKGREQGRERKDASRALFSLWYRGEGIANYDGYPIKKGVGAAEKAWAKIKPSEELANEMIQAVQNQIAEQHWKKEAGIFVAEWKHPSTWLNQKSWLDEVAPGKSKPVQRTMEDLEAEYGEFIPTHLLPPEHNPNLVRDPDE